MTKHVLIEQRFVSAKEVTAKIMRTLAEELRNVLKECFTEAL
jgi:hypothetical protein